MNGKKTSGQLAWLIRRHGVEMTALSGGSHIGAILSVADIMGVLYTDILKFDKDDPEWDGRDRFILSKGHSGASVYAALAENGFFSVEELKTHYADGSRLSCISPPPRCRLLYRFSRTWLVRSGRTRSCGKARR